MWCNLYIRGRSHYGRLGRGYAGILTRTSVVAAPVSSSALKSKHGHTRFYSIKSFNTFTGLEEVIMG